MNTYLVEVEVSGREFYTVHGEDLDDAEARFAAGEGEIVSAQLVEKDSVMTSEVANSKVGREWVFDADKVAYPSWTHADGRYQIRRSDHNGNELYHLVDRRNGGLSRGLYPSFEEAADRADGS